ncbi:MAG: hypothetical protein Q7R77_01565 [Candidatus Daviesbacteria bacterium]|nr:hypothetical protein [Candidatus Daviesbacteria bacterium]
MKKVEEIISKYWFLIICLLSFPAIRALFVSGYFGASDDMHIAWLYEIDKIIKLGQIPPRFVPDLSFGFGYPLFNFVFPLPFYIGEIFHLLGLSFVDSIKAVFLISVPLSGIFMYLLLRQFVERNLSLIGAVLYIYTPYRSVDLYVRGAIGEIVGFVFLPLIILSAAKIFAKGNFKWIGIGALSIASLVLSHNIAAYMFFPFVGFLLIIQFFLTPLKKEYITKAFLMIFLGLLTSIYFWLPALTESNLVKQDTVFNFADHFPTLLQLIRPYWGYGASVPGPYDGMSFFLGIANILLLFSGICLFIFRWKQISIQRKVFIGWVLGVITVAIFLMNYRSTIIWNNFPFLAYFQFPWRFLILTTFFIPLLLIIFDKIRINNLLLTILLLLIIISSMSYFRPQDFLGRLDNYYLNRYIPTPAASKEYLQLQEEYLRLPKAAESRPDKNYPMVFPDSGIIKVNKRSDLDVVIESNSNVESLINLNKYYFPGWKAKIDGKKMDIWAGKPFGQISFSMPAGYHKAEIYFTETTFRSLLNFASLGAFLVSLVVLSL